MYTRTSTRELVVQDIEGALADVDPVRYSPCTENLSALTPARLKLATGAV